MDGENKINQIRQELIELYKRRQSLVEQSMADSQLTEPMPSDNMDVSDGMANNSSKSMEAAKVLTLSNGHSILGDNNKSTSGFINMVIMALLAGFASGVVAMAIYIFMNLGKVTVSL